jgi:branched-chain amino acid transport system ATP-binding protein
MSPLLSITALTHRYGELTALAGVDLTVTEGGRHAIVGANGAGKTTLLGLVAGTIRPPTAGRIDLAGRDITRLAPARRARAGIARTFQSPQLLDTATALDNIVLAAWWRTAGRVAWAPTRYRRLAVTARQHLADVGLHGCAEQPAGALPHGKRRLLELAVALASRPRLLLLDEPAAGLAPDDREPLLAALRQLPPTVAVLLVDHHLSIVSALDAHVTVLAEGRAVMSGPARQVLTHPDFRIHYLRTATVIS